MGEFDVVISHYYQLSTFEKICNILLAIGVIATAVCLFIQIIKYKKTKSSSDNIVSLVSIMSVYLLMSTVAMFGGIKTNIDDSQLVDYGIETYSISNGSALEDMDYYCLYNSKQLVTMDAIMKDGSRKEFYIASSSLEDTTGLKYIPHEYTCTLNFHEVK